MYVVMMSDSTGFVTVTSWLFRYVLGLRRFGRLLCVLWVVHCWRYESVMAGAAEHSNLALLRGTFLDF